MSQRIIALVGVAIILLTGIVGVNAAFANSGPHQESTESFTPDAGNITTFNNSHVDALLYDSAAEVRDENNRLMVEGEDYQWYHKNGTLKTLKGGQLEGDSSAEITYGWGEPDSQARMAASLLGYGFNAASAFIYVIGIGLVLGAVRLVRRFGS